MIPKHSEVVKAVEILDQFEVDEITDIIYDLAFENPGLFVNVVDGIQALDHARIFHEMREETCNGYPMYPELQ